MSSSADSVYLPETKQFGFCEGVVAADDFLRRISNIAAELGVAQVYGYHDIVHNKTVSQYHEENGVVFVDSLDNVPSGSIVVGSAHGSSPVVSWTIESEGGLFFDGACPLVIHTHKAVEQARRKDEKVLYLLQGNPDKLADEKVHDEVRGTIGHMDYYILDGQLRLEPIRRAYVELGDRIGEILPTILDEKARYRIVGQTTLLATGTLEYREMLASYIQRIQPDASVERVERRDVCFAVEDRQQGVRVLLERRPGTLVVVTDPKSKNGKGYAELASSIIDSQGLETRVVMVADIDAAKQLGKIEGTIALTASASTPDTVTREVVEHFGGDGSLVPSARESFNLRNSSEIAVRDRILRWKQGKP